MPLSDHVSLTISQDSVGVARAGFGVPLILSHTAAWAERVRSYASLASVAADFPITTSWEYRAAQAMFSQSPCPEQIKIGRAALAPSQKYAIDIANVRNTYTYTISVDGKGVTSTDVSYAADSATTDAEIANGLVAALNAVASRNYLAAFATLSITAGAFTAANATEIFTKAAHGLMTGDGPLQVSNSGGALPAGLAAVTDYYVIRIDANTFYLATSRASALAGTFLSITADGTGTQTIASVAGTVRPSDPFTVTGIAAGDWFALEVNPADLTIAQTHADPGIATDLAAIALADPDWYALCTGYNSSAMVAAAAAWIEANARIYVFDVNETDAITTVVGSVDTLDDLFTSNYSRSMGAYHPSPADCMAAAWLGRCLPIDPGGETWKFKTLAGVAPVSLSGTHRVNLVARRANSYERIAGIAITFEGTTPSSFLDIVRGLDWVKDDMTKGVYGALAGRNKVPYTDGGIAVVEAEVRASLSRAVTMGIFSSSPVPVVTVPKVASVASNDKATRILRNVKWSATLAGAIHKVIATGVVSV